MNFHKFVLGIIGVLAFATATFGGWNFRAAAKAKQELAAENRRQDELRLQIETLKARQKMSAENADEIERDNATLASSIEKVRVAAKTAAALPTLESVEARFKEAQLLAETGDAETALRELLWCYDEGFSRVPSSNQRMRLRAVVSAIGKLSARYPAALDALRERFDKARQRLISTFDSNTVTELSSLARVLKDERALVALYDEIPSGDRRRQSLAIYAFDQFVEAKRYQDALVGRRYASMNASFEMHREDRDYAIKSAATNIEVLAGAGDLEHARALAGRVLNYDSTPETHALLQKHLERAGQPGLLSSLPKS